MSTHRDAPHLWTDDDVGRLLSIAVSLPRSDPKGTSFWEAVEAFAATYLPAERQRLEREMARILPRVNLRAAAEIRRVYGKLNEGWLRRQLKGLEKEGAS